MGKLEQLGGFLLPKRDQKIRSGPDFHHRAGEKLVLEEESEEAVGLNIKARL